VAAQTVLDAGALQQQIERQRPQPVPTVNSPDKSSSPVTLASNSGPTVTVRQFMYEGNTLVTSLQLDSVLARFVNQSLNFTQLQEAAATVSKVYRDAGWMVMTYLPLQDIQEGVVRIQIVEAVFGKVRHEGAVPKWVSRQQIDKLFAAQQPTGQTVSLYALDRALLLTNDLPGISVAASLAAGTQEGETDLVLTSYDEPIAIGEIAADNFGARSIGTERQIVNLELRSPLRIGDLLSSSLIHGNGSDYKRLAYTMPIGNQGWRMGLSASHLSYRLVGRDFFALDASGASNSASVEGSYPLIRSRQGNLYLDLQYTQSQFTNQSLGHISSQYKIRTSSVGLTGNQFDQWHGGGITSTNLAWINGQRDDDLRDARDQFNKLKFAVSRQQVISPSVSFHAALAGQASRSALDSSEKYYLGGATGVRAYPANEGVGSSGFTSNLELEIKLDEAVTLGVFYDFGHVNDSYGDGSASYSIKGAGLSIGLQSHAGVTMKATWAHRLGDNPNPTSAGLDQDGSLDKDRWWLSAKLPF
jgi:hemolysin activation/secretion protein